MAGRRTYTLRALLLFIVLVALFLSCGLKRLSLARTTITDDGLQQLSRLRHLDVLFLDHTGITDAGLQHLKGLSKLKSLSLRGTSDTDRGLEQLSNLTQLENLVNQDTDVTLAGVAHLFMDLQRRELGAGLAAFIGNFPSLGIGGPPGVRLMS